MKITITLSVIGGKITTGKPIGPALALYGIDINKAAKLIDDVTKNMPNIEQKVDITIETDDRSFAVSTIKPKAPDLIKLHAQLENNIKTITKDKLIMIAYIINPDLRNKPDDLNTKIKELEGTCKSMQIKVI